MLLAVFQSFCYHILSFKKELFHFFTKYPLGQKFIRGANTMAKFLTTTGVSHHLETLVNKTDDFLFLISPFLKINDRLRYALEDLNRMKIDIRIVYGKSELKPSEVNWLQGMDFIRTSYCENLHAKCYISEDAAIITSMNLYEFSQVNNEEMGILVIKEDDPNLYDKIYQEARRLVRVSDEVELSVKKVPRTNDDEKITTRKEEGEAFCIRCQKRIKLNPQAPYCNSCYRTWKRFENKEYQEKYCHICGKEHAVTMVKPVCYSCFKANRKLFQTS